MSEDRFTNRYRIPSTRAPWHYYDGGSYFVTICTAQREHFFGEIQNERMLFSPIGQYADNCWREIPQHFPNVETPLWVVMPNHIHGIIVINKNVETQNFASLRRQTSTNKFGPQSKNLASVIRGFKIGVTKYAHEHAIPFQWQTRFYDHIARNQNELNRIALYIEQNVAKWNEDELY